MRAQVATASAAVFEHFLGSASDMPTLMQTPAGQESVKKRLNNLREQVRVLWAILALAHQRACSNSLINVGKGVDRSCFSIIFRHAE